MASEIKVDTIVNAGGDNDSGIDLSTNDVVKVNIAGSEKARVHSDGKVGIGTTSPTAKLAVSGTGTVDLGIGSTNAGGAYLYLDGDSNGDFSGSDYSYIGHDTSGQLLIHQDSPSGSDNILFKTNATERMRIDSSGRLLVGTTSTVQDTDQVLHVSASQACNMQATVSSADGGSVLNLKRSGNTQGDFIRLFNSSGSETGQIRVDSGGTTQFENVSDYRLKENINDWDVDATTKVKQIKIKTFDWKDQTAQTNGKGLVGVIAHELQEVYPHCVSGEKDGYGADVDKDGNKKPMYQGVDYGKLTPLLTKALQEALAKIETLEAKVTALESK